MPVAAAKAPDEFPIDLLAKVAVHFLPLGHSARKSASLACDLLDACREEAWTRSFLPVALAAFDPSEAVPFRKAAVEITQLRDPRYASARCTTFFREVLWPFADSSSISGAKATSKEDGAESVESVVAMFRDKGIPRILIAFYQPWFEMSKPKRRKTPKSRAKWRTMPGIQEISH